MRVKDQVVLITGANGGLGTALTRAFLKAGAKKVYAAARNPASAAALVEAGQGRVAAIQLDVTKPGDLTAAAASCPDATILVNNAGINRYTGATADGAVEVARAEMDTNYFGLLGLSRAFAPVLKKNGGGAIVSVLTLVSFGNFAAMATYCASKAAAQSIVQALRFELRKQGTLVAAAFPGAVDTPLTAGYDGPKDDPDAIAAEIVSGIEAGSENIWPGDWSKQVGALVGGAIGDLEKQLAAFAGG